MADMDFPRLSQMLAQGGDERITIDPRSGRNRYLSATTPRGALAYGSSTANDISADAYAHLLGTMPANGMSDGVWQCTTARTSGLAR